MKPMKICLSSTEYPPETGGGGIGTQTYLKATGLSARGHTVHVVAASHNIHSRTYQDQGATIHRIGEVPLALPGHELGTYWMAYSFAVAAKITQLHEEIGFDIIQFPEYGGEGFAFQTDTFAHRTAKYVVQMHGPIAMFTQYWEWPAPGSPLHRIGCFMEKTSLEFADLLLASTAHTARYCQQAYGVDTSAARIVYSGINASHFAPRPVPADARWPRILFVGTLSGGKGLLDVIQVVARLKGRFPQIVLRAIGKAGEPEMVELQETLDASGIGANFELVGYVPYDRLPEQYAWCDIFAAPSVYEGGPGNVYFEAMACGKPVIACNTGGIPEVAPHMETAWLIAPHDLANLEQAIVTLAEDAELRDRLGREGRRRIEENFSIEKYLDRCEGYYRELL